MKSIFNLKRVAQAFALAAVLSAPVAHANVTDWAIHDPLEVGGGGVLSPGLFDDFFKFTMPNSGGLSSVAVSNNLLTILGITSGTVKLWQGTYDGDSTGDILKLTYSFDGTTGNTPHTIGGLINGANYYYEVSGTASGSVGGIYVLTSTLVPEADTYAMMLAGLGLMAFVARRRKKSQDVTAA